MPRTIVDPQPGASVVTNKVDRIGRLPLLETELMKQRPQVRGVTRGVWYVDLFERIVDSSGVA